MSIAQPADRILLQARILCCVRYQREKPRLLESIAEAMDINLLPENIHNIVVVIVGVLWPMAGENGLAGFWKTLAQFMEDRFQKR